MVEHLPNLGGSLRLFIRHEEYVPYEDAPFAAELQEQTYGLTDLNVYTEFSKKISYVKNDLVDFLLRMKTGGKTVGGYGAPAKATVLLNYCGIGKDLMPYVVDTTPYKQGKYIPGVGIPILPEEHIFVDQPDYILLFPWNLKKEIIGRIGSKLTGKFVTAIPELTIA